MEKISGILPKSPRLASVDEEAAPPARPGSPTQGRNVGTSDLRDRVTLSSITKAKDIGEVAGYNRLKEAKQAKIVEELNKKFFNTKPTPALAQEELIDTPIVVAVTVRPTESQPANKGIEGN